MTGLEHFREDIEIGIALIALALAITPPRMIRMRRMSSLVVGFIGVFVASRAFLEYQGIDLVHLPIALGAMGAVFIVMAITIWRHKEQGSLF